MTQGRDEEAEAEQASDVRREQHDDGSEDRVPVLRSSHGSIAAP